MHFGFGEFLTLLGSLGLFLYGMKVMSDALLEVAGDRMRTILATMTSNRVFAVFTGFLITSVIQSSSATTLMVVSFANAALLTLTESIGVIMGANIGTTVTAWLITILGFKVSMSAIALPLVGLGFLLIFSKNRTRKQWGYFIVGFAILFIGLQFLKDSVPDIRNNAEALAFLTKYTAMGFPSILIFLFIGTILTVVIQSSSATMALTLVMCFEGWIPFDMAAAMVLGENIGTTITANLAAIVANFNAKRTARAHLIFNLIGVVWVLVLFAPFLRFIVWVTGLTGSPSPYSASTAIPVALSLFHTIFNLVNTFLLIWFIPFIARIVQWMVRERKDPEKQIDEPMYIDVTNLEYPETGIAALYRESLRLFEDSAFKAIAHGINVHRTDIASDKKIKELIDRREIIQIDLEDIYYRRIKVIYNKIVEFATVLQSRFELSKKKIQQIRNILLANRHLVAAVKEMNLLNKNMAIYIDSENYHIKKHYNYFRKMILKVLREILDLKTTKDPDKHFEKLDKLKSKTDKTDVLLDGSIEKLVRQDKITNDMATSLMNDSAIVNRLIHNLINFAELLFNKRDTILDAEFKGRKDLTLEKEGILSEDDN